MTRFSEITYDEEIETAVVGAGLLWNEVYAPLDPLGGGVVGGRAPGIWRCWVHTGWRVLVDTNERGLALDNVVGFELVKPDGGVALVSDKSDPNLFFVLKGGYNNYAYITLLEPRAPALIQSARRPGHRDPIHSQKDPQ